MGKIFGNTLTTPINPDKLKNENGTGGGITEQEVEEMLRMFADTVVSEKADKNDVYTKLEHEESVGRVIDGIVFPAIAKKADKDDVYLKDEIDLRLGDVDLALDRIIEIQNSFMPGGIPGEPNVPGGDA